MTHHICYHAHCVDGLGAAYAAWAALGEDATRYHPVAYGDPLPDIDPDDSVSFLDFSPPRAQILALAQIAAAITIIDHHASAQRALAGLPDAALDIEGACEISITFDMDHSGAVLAWHHYHPGRPVPRVLELIEDRDLWRFDIPGSRALHYDLETLPDFRDLRHYADHGAFVIEGIETGSIILDHLELQWAELAKRAAQIPWTTPAGDPCTLVACPSPSQWFSDLGHVLLESHPEADVAALYADNLAEGHTTVSLRSRTDGPDVSRIAAAMGGGGHPHAAGFRIQRSAPPVLIW